jgi:hypothetical protein
MPDPPQIDDEHADWGASWEAHAREQMALGLTVSPAKRLEWLESMIELAFRSGALPRARRDPWLG